MKILTLGDYDMNTRVNQKQVAGLSRFSALCTGVLIVLAAVVSAAALADEAATKPSETAVERLSLGDLDLSTAEGKRVAQTRILDKANRLCAQLAESRDVGRQWHFHACVHEAIASTLRQINAPAVAATRSSGVARTVTR
jgi:UrcA family protein